MLHSRLPFLARVFLFHIAFLLVHYIYDWFPNPATSFIGATNESVYQHMKAAFYASLLLSVFEATLTRKAIASFPAYFYSRLFTAVFLPLAMFLFFLLGPALFIKIENIPLEIVFANLALLAASASVFVLDTVIETPQLSRSAKWTLLALFLISALEFTVFNIRLPWFDVFAIPPGW